MKAKRCKACGETFVPRRPIQIACSYECALNLVKEKRAKEERVAQAQERKTDRARLDAMKPRGQWVREAQTAVNRWARWRDILAGRGCISCGAPYRGAFGGAFDAGHYRSVGSAPHARYCLSNIHLQCHKCNRFLGGNAVSFRAGLIERYGAEFVEGIESMQGTAKWSVEYLKRLKAVATKRARRLQKRVERANA